jgi:hypothetical protein
MFAVVFLFLAFSVLIIFFVALAMFLEVAFFPERRKGTNGAKERFAMRQQVALSGSTQPIGRATLVKQSKQFESKRTSKQLRPRPHM